MKKSMMIFLIFSFFLAGNAWGQDSSKNMEGQKITPIKGVIMLCVGQTNTEECDEGEILLYLNNSHIRILTRKHLKAILDEKSLLMSGLTEREKSEELGKMLGASHILLFKKISDKWGYSMDYQLININSSEIEYSTRRRDLDTRKTKIKFDTTADFVDKILNQHLAH